jgi:acetyl-CoA carboxylase carboxyl transferase subunit alpha
MDTLPHEKQIQEYIKSIDRLKKQSKDQPLFMMEVCKLEDKLEQMKQNVYAELSPWERISISRHAKRPHALDYIHGICDSFTELCGDRNYSDDHSIIGGLARIDGEKFIIVGQEKGHDIESRLHHNFGMPNPEGFRKVLRLVKLAEKFNLPVISLIDTPGANPALEAEERGQAWAIAANLREMARLLTPIIVVLIGEGCSGGALGMAIGDSIGMLEHAYYSAISPEGCASILWKDPSKKIEASEALKLTVEDMMELGIVDALIREPLGGAHQDPAIAIANTKAFILEHACILKKIAPEALVEQRYMKFRSFGAIEEIHG